MQAALVRLFASTLSLRLALMGETSSRLQDDALRLLQTAETEAQALADETGVPVSAFLDGADQVLHSLRLTAGLFDDDDEDDDDLGPDMD